MKQLLRIDEISAVDHTYITEQDILFYFVEYTSGKDYTYSDGNDLINNLKKSVRYRDQPPWHYKTLAIASVAAMIRSQVVERIDLNQVTFVPLPPSKTSDHELYDNRILQVITKACRGKAADIRELLQIKASRPAAHEQDLRPTIADLEHNFLVNEALVPGVRHTIYLVDDVLTNGTTFIAARNILQQYFPDAQYVGLFVARRALEKGNMLDFLEDW